MNIKEEIRKAIKYGIVVDVTSEQEEHDYLKSLFDFMIKKKNFCLFDDVKRIITVSADHGDLAQIYIHSFALRIIPVSSEGYFKIFMDVLEYVADRHKEELRQLEELSEDESTEEYENPGDVSPDDDGDWWL